MAILTLKVGGIRQPHWHPFAWELNYVISGKAEWSIVGTNGQHDSFIANVGDLVFIPRGIFHYFANADSEEELKVLIIFNSSQVVEDDDIGIVPSLNEIPIDILAASFGMPKDYFKDIPRNATSTPIIIRKDTKHRNPSLLRKRDVEKSEQFTDFLFDFCVVQQKMSSYCFAFVAIIAVIGTIVVDDASGTLIPTCSVASHSCSSTDAQTITGSFIMINADFTLLTSQKASLISCFTNQLRLSSSLNIKVTVQVQAIDQLSNGDCRVSYKCSGVGHHPSALSCLKATPNCDAFKTILGKCFRSSGTKVGVGLPILGGLLGAVGGILKVGSGIVGGLLAAVTSHTCSSTGTQTIAGSFIIVSVDLTLVTAQKASIASCFTNQLRLSHSLNIKAIVEVQGIDHLDNGDCRVSYKCSGVGHHPSALSCLKATPNCDAFKTILGKCSRSSGTQVVENNNGDGQYGGNSNGDGQYDGSNNGDGQYDGSNNGDVQGDGSVDVTVTSNTCTSTDSQTIEGSFDICNADLELLKAQKDSFESCCANQLRSSHSLNIKISVEVQEFEQLENGDCRVSYKCSGVGHHPSALSCLKTCPNTNPFRDILGKCSLQKW
ncbi:unnamed protein product [Adineta steineri]|uniref:Cupin type-1 domain-containing protein n=1 Tax=Adineta steineri TaxID=433720 RepID=A0A819CKW7_9BILA|nr:unnamed protein product [Adineta steineri]